MRATTRLFITLFAVNFGCRGADAPDPDAGGASGSGSQQGEGETGAREDDSTGTTGSRDDDALGGEGGQSGADAPQRGDQGGQGGITVVGGAPVAPAEKPNVIYILADDAGIGDFGVYGGQKIDTPHIDRLAATGMRFTRHYSGSPVCAPSRSVLMTSLHTGHTRVRGNSHNTLRAEDVTVAEVLKQGGYHTGAIGKWGLGNANDAGAPWKQGFDFFFGYLDQTHAHRYYVDFLWRNGVKVTYPDNSKQRQHYSHDLMTEEALGFIRRNKDKSFFLYLPYTIPHVDLDVPDDSKSPYQARFGPEKPFPGDGSYRAEPYPRATFAGMVSRMDRDVGRIVALLQELGLHEDTLVIFTSDNGATVAGGADPGFFDSNGPYRGVKRDLYEGGIITPMIASWPGHIEENSTTSHLSGHQDVLPTLAELAGVEPPAGLDGISLVPTLLGRPAEQAQHDYLYWEFPEAGGRRAIRQGAWKAVQYGTLASKTGPIALYDLDQDPGEENDLANQHTERVTALTRLMDEAHRPDARYPLFVGE